MSLRLLELLAEQGGVDWRIFGFLDERSYFLLIAASSCASGSAGGGASPRGADRGEGPPGG